jgi:hypothetical protein
MPPGKQSLTPTSDSGEGIDLTINVDAAIVEVLARDADKIRSEGHDLYIDFNHNDDQGAAGWVESFYWAGEDPLTGGIRANIKWTADGINALQGKKFKRFSPSFMTAKGRVTGLGNANVGDLTNRPAFTENQAVVAQKTTNEKTKMDPEDIKAIAVAVAASVGTKVKAAEDDKKDDDKMKALKAENDELKEKLKESAAKAAKAEEDEEEKKDASAASAVANAVKLGIVGPKDKDKIASLTVSAKANPEAFEMLIASHKVNASNPGRITPLPPQDTAVDMAPEKQISVAVKARQASTGESASQAFTAIQAERPELFA